MPRVRAAVLHGIKDLRVEDIDILHETLPPNFARIQIKCCGGKKRYFYLSSSRAPKSCLTPTVLYYSRTILMLTTPIPYTTR